MLKRSISLLVAVLIAFYGPTPSISSSQIEQEHISPRSRFSEDLGTLETTTHELEWQFASLMQAFKQGLSLALFRIHMDAARQNANRIRAALSSRHPSPQVATNLDRVGQIGDGLRELEGKWGRQTPEGYVVTRRNALKLGIGALLLPCAACDLFGGDSPTQPQLPDPDPEVLVDLDVFADLPFLHNGVAFIDQQRFGPREQNGFPFTSLYQGFLEDPTHH